MDEQEDEGPKESTHPSTEASQSMPEGDLPNARPASVPSTPPAHPEITAMQVPQSMPEGNLPNARPASVPSTPPAGPEITAMQAPQSMPEGDVPSAHPSSAHPMPPAALPSNRQSSRATSGILWALFLVILAAILGTLGQGAIQEWHDWYYAPRLQMSYSVFTLATASHRQDDSTVNYALLFDAIEKCSIIEYQVRSDQFLGEIWGSTSETFWKIYLHNGGRSPVTEISFALDEGDGEKVEVETTPNLVVGVRRVQTATGIGEQVISIRELAPGAFGMITIRDKKDDGLRISVEEAGGHLAYKLSGQLLRRVSFQGSKELGGKGEFYPADALDILYQESRIYGEPDLRIPFVEGNREASGGERLVFPQFLYPDQDVACSFSPSIPRRFTAAMTVHVRPSKAHPGGYDIPYRWASVPDRK